MKRIQLIVQNCSQTVKRNIFKIEASCGFYFIYNNKSKIIHNTHQSPECSSSKPSLILSKGILWVINSSKINFLSMYSWTSFGTLSFDFQPPKAVPFQVLPVTSWNGRVLISCPAAATPIITETPQPLWHDSKAAL